MIVTLINHTPDAAGLLMKTKDTRLMTLDQFAEKDEYTDDQVDEQLEYISNTIRSSWEFVDYVFLIQDVSRNFTHQFVRNRHGVYAQQTMRLTDMSNFDYRMGPTIHANNKAAIKFAETMELINSAYQELIKMPGVKIEDARDILPGGIYTNIVAKYDLRTLADMFDSRSSIRTQGEFRDVIGLMIKEVLRVHPWAVNFLCGKRQQSAKELATFINESDIDSDTKVILNKHLDQLR